MISIFDKELQRELIDSSTYGANAYLHVTGGEGSRLLHCDFSLPPPELTITQPSGMSYMIAQVGSAQMISFRQKSEPGSLSGRVMLYDDRKRIDFVNYINKKRNLGKESGYFAFPFAFEKPEIRLETPGAVIRADADQIKGACPDWHCVDGFVTVSDGSAEVVWAPRQSPLITIGDINRGQWRERLDISNGTLFAYVFNNYWFTNYKADQEGMLPFVFSITSGTSFTDSEARRFAENARTPMLSAMASAQIAGQAQAAGGGKPGGGGREERAGPGCQTRAFHRRHHNPPARDGWSVRHSEAYTPRHSIQAGPTLQPGRRCDLGTAAQGRSDRSAV